MFYKKIITTTIICASTLCTVDLLCAEEKVVDSSAKQLTDGNNLAKRGNYTSLNDLKDSERNTVEDEIMQNRYDVKKFNNCEQKDLSPESEVLASYSERVKNELKQYKKKTQLLYDKLTSESKEALNKIKQEQKNFEKINNCGSK